MFGNSGPAQSSLFGNSATTEKKEEKPASSGSLFGGSKPAEGGLFSKPTTGGLFSNPSAPAAQAGSLFGGAVKPKESGGLFSFGNNNT
jgi:hypothetical protein